MKKKEKNIGKKASVIRSGWKLGLGVIVIVGLIWASAGPYPQIINSGDGKSWHVIWEGSFADAAEADPGAGNSGILSIYLHPHQATPHNAYYENSSGNLETNCSNGNLGYANADDTQVDIAHSTAFDIVVRVRGEADHCKRGAVWFDTDLRVRLTSADLAITADTELTVTSNGTWTANNTNFDFLYMNFWDDNGGDGYQIAKDTTAEIQNIKFEAYY